jgi:hypothetical protein
VITGWDDYFVHQTPQPILTPNTDDPHWMDRFWWGALSEDASTYIAVALGQYRVTRRMDAIVYLIRDGRHRILKLAKNLSPEDFVRPKIGPLDFDILEPLTQWHWSLGENPTDITWDLNYQAGRQLKDYDQFKFGTEAGNYSDYHHYQQNGISTGTISADGTDIAGSRFITIRDRSWGLRRAREQQGFFLWLHHSFASKDVCVVYTQRRDGTVSFFDGAVTDDRGQRRIVGIGHDMKLGPGRDCLGGTVTVLDDEGNQHRLDYERVQQGYAGPVGYGGWAGRDHSAEMTEADGYWYQTDELDLNRDPADIISSQPVHIFEHPSRIWLDGGEQTVGIISGGFTRSSNFTYRPQPLTRTSVQ